MLWGEHTADCLNLGAPATPFLSSELIPPFSCLYGTTHDIRVPYTCTRRGTITRIHLVRRKGCRTLHFIYMSTFRVHVERSTVLLHSLIQLANRGTTVGASPDPFPCSIWSGRIFEMGGFLHTHFNCSVLETPDVGLNKVVWCWTMSNTHHRTVCTHAQHTKCTWSATNALNLTS